MKTLLGMVAALVLSISMTSSAEAKGSMSGGKTASSFRNSKNLGSMHSSFHGHHSYQRDYRGFSQRRWFSEYRCFGHYCPTRSCWYYLYERGNCYLPISVVQTYAPTEVTPNLAPNLAPNLPPVKPVVATPNLAPVKPVKPVKPIKPV